MKKLFELGLLAGYRERADRNLAVGECRYMHSRAPSTCLREKGVGIHECVLCRGWQEGSPAIRPSARLCAPHSTRRTYIRYKPPVIADIHGGSLRAAFNYMSRRDNVSIIIIFISYATTSNIYKFPIQLHRHKRSHAVIYS